MPVIFDEVTTEVQQPPAPSTPSQEQGEPTSTPSAQLRQWQQHQATMQRRRRRLEAD